MRTLSVYFIVVLLTAFTSCIKKESENDIPQLEWMTEVGAKRFPSGSKTYNADDFGAVGDALKMCTSAIQDAIDRCSQEGGGIVTFRPGKYLTGSLFLKDNVNLHIPKGTVLIGSLELDDYKEIATRVAGIEMSWPAALVNVLEQENVAITGDGTIDGRGKVFWDKYYKMRNEYAPKGLRWIVDYDCQRPRGILIADSRDVTVKDVVLFQPAFWSLHILYSEYVTVDNIIISNNIEGKGPSTDGVDIDSSSKILVQNSYINCNDDNFCLKAGRDSDGLRVNRPCEYVVIRDCVAGHGDGLFTCGSETSGSIRNIVAYNLKGIGTKYGLRFKSTMQRGGVIENIYLSNIEMKNVRNPFVIDLNWHPSYSNSVLPDGYCFDSLPSHWKQMLTPVPETEGIPKFRKVFLKNISAQNAITCIRVKGNPKSTIDWFSLDNVVFSGEKPGVLDWCRHWQFNNFSIQTSSDASLEIANSTDVNI